MHRTQILLQVCGARLTIFFMVDINPTDAGSGIFQSNIGLHRKPT